MPSPLRPRRVASIAVAPIVLALAGLVPLPRTPNAVAGEVRLTVTTTNDAFDGVCDETDCTLRDAVAAAPAGAVVRVPSGVYPLTRTGPGGVREGDLDLRAAITIRAVGETGVFVDASGLGDRAFTLGSATVARTYTLEGLTVFGARDASIHGAAISLQGGRAELSHVGVIGSRGGSGGGVRTAPGTSLRVVGSLFLGNTAAASGGAIHAGGDLELERTTIAGNAAVDGGGIAAVGGDLDVRSSTIAENVASGEGGGLLLDTDATLTSVTVADNEAARGGGIRRNSGEVSLGRSIVARNQAERRRDCAGELTSEGGNLGTRACGLQAPADLVGVDPELRRLDAFGGPTPTIALRPGSPAIDATDGCARTDQRGAPRDRRCDTGAYELVRCLGEPVNIVGTADEDELSGGRGSDVFLGRGGDDEFQGSIGKDRACGGAGDDLLIAGPGDDRFHGQAGDDRVKGEAGDDRVWGGPGRDRLVGGPGEDRCERAAIDRDPRGCESASLAS